jgi:hypothetical protein
MVTPADNRNVNSFALFLDRQCEQSSVSKNDQRTSRKQSSVVLSVHPITQGFPSLTLKEAA